jgi:hypothetical protein
MRVNFGIASGSSRNISIVNELRRLQIGPQTEPVCGSMVTAALVVDGNVLNDNPEQNTSRVSFLRRLSIVPPCLTRLGVKLER